MSSLEMFISALGGATVPAAIIGYLGKTFIDERLKKDFADYQLIIAEQSDIRSTVKKYSRVILLSAGDLQDRLWHLCKRIATATDKVLLAKDEFSPMYGAWPMTKRHYLTSTMYLVAKYFFWVEILKSRISLLQFNDDANTSEFNYHLKRVERMFAETTHLQKFAELKVSIDKPVFQLMQSEIGECLRTGTGAEDQCMSFHQFRIDYDKLIKESEGLQQLQSLLLSSMSDDPSNFCLNRLKLISNALKDMMTFLYKINKLSPSEQLKQLDTGAFRYDDYLTEWPPTPGPTPSSLPSPFGGR